MTQFELAKMSMRVSGMILLSHGEELMLLGKAAVEAAGDESTLMLSTPEHKDILINLVAFFAAHQIVAHHMSQQGLSGLQAVPEAPAGPASPQEPVDPTSSPPSI